jgi:hypothetical protein
MQGLKPVLVVPDHMADGTKLNASAIRYTRAYLRRFQAGAAKASPAPSSSTP